jgi:peptide subunit release factor RF-3
MSRNFIEIPSLDQIEAMDKQRQKAIESLEISEDHLKCQGCGSLWPIVKDDNMKKLVASNRSGRIHDLQKRIGFSEGYFHANTCKVEKEELAALLEEDKQKEILRRIPLYSSKITGYRFLRSKCYECQSAIGNGVLLTLQPGDDFHLQIREDGTPVFTVS